MKAPFSLSVCTVLAACLSLANAHGTVTSFTANNVTHRGPLEGRGSTMESPIRQVANLNPVSNLFGGDMACGAGAASSARTIAKVTAGSTVEYRWTAGPTFKWPHRYGPCMLYAYKCPGNNAKECKPPSGAEWVLVEALGFDPNPNEVPAGGNPARTGWYQDRARAGMGLKFKVSANFPNGHYLFRHEIIALHLTGRPETYPSCTQVEIINGKGGNLRDQGAKFVKFPGEYNAGQAGLKVNVFDNGLNARNYVMPGPARFVGNGNGNPKPSNSSSTPKPSSVAPSKTADPKPTQTTGPKRCKTRRDEHGNLVKRSEWIEMQKRNKHRASRAFQRDLHNDHNHS